MISEKNKWFSGLLAAVFFSVLCVSSAWADAEMKDTEVPDAETQEMEDPFEGKPPLADQLKQFSNEIAKRMHQELQELLDKELQVLKKERNKNRYTDQERVTKHEGIIKDDPKNAEAHFALGEVYDDMRDGANAILHTQIAEQLFKEQKNKKGLAESRRNLRWFFEKYGYKKEDFMLN